MNRAKPADVAIAVGALVCTIALGVIAMLAYMHGRAADPPPSPAALDAIDRLLGEEEPADGDGFPIVDWAYWHRVNPDVVGWVTVPGTAVDYPVCQAPEDDPDFYLTHDVHRDWNFYGAVFLDADCAESGLMGSANAVVMGHHMDDGSMFAPLASYGDASWAEEHRTVLVQTPDDKAELEVLAADVVDAEAEPKRTLFSDAEDYREWAEDAVAKSDVVLDGDAEPERMYTFATCSYHRWWNERTLVYATPAG